MCRRLGHGSSDASKLQPGAARPPVGSRLGQSLERGCFAKDFGRWELLGSGGFGKVLKALHIASGQWYAVKLIPMQLRASETVDDDHDSWSGPKVFERLCRIRTPHVVRYYRRWTELPEDLPFLCGMAPPDGGMPQPATPETAAPTSVWSQPSVTNASASVANSEGGFEWLLPSRPAPPMPSDEDSDEGARASSPEARHNVVLMVQMEYCEGVTLADWLAQPASRPGLAKGSLDGALELFSQLMSGLQDLHEVDIVHCDVKPANVLVTKAQGQIKLLDFGLSRLRSNSVQRVRLATRVPPAGSSEGSRTAVGTPGYAPPEHCAAPSSPIRPFGGSEARGVRLSAMPGADIFSAGVVLVELLMAAVSGGSAWGTAMERAGALAALREGRGGMLPLPLLKARGVSGWLRQLALRMLAWDPEVRPTAREVMGELEAGASAVSRHNPYLGTQDVWSPRLVAAPSPPAAPHNPYVGFFLEHRAAAPRGGSCLAGLHLIGGPIDNLTWELPEACSAA